MIRTFITGAGGGIGQGIIKSLRLIKDLDIEIIAADMSPKATGLYFADKACLVPPVKNPGYLEEIIRILKSENCDFYFPGTDIELPLCAENKDRIEKESGARVHISPKSVIDISNDKLETYRFLKSNGFPAPESWDAHKVECLNSIPLPVIAKPRRGFRSIGVMRLTELHELKDVAENKSDYIFQEIAGPDDQEYTCTVVIVNGECSRPVSLKRTLRAGDTFQAIPVELPEIQNLLKAVAIKLGINGSCNFQLRCKENVPYIFEINSRFSGTTPFLAQIGCNPVEFYIKKMLNIDCPWEPLKNVSIMRHWTETVIDNRCIQEFEGSKVIQPEVISVSKL